VFCANWYTQAFSLLYDYTNEKLKQEIRKVAFEFQDRIEATSFYEDIRRNPRKCATVHVACGLEGLADAYKLLNDEEVHSPRGEKYRKYLQLMMNFLFEVQLKPGDAPTTRGIGGFGHSMYHSVQRIDVTGHVASGFIKVEKLINAGRLSLYLQNNEPHPAPQEFSLK